MDSIRIIPPECRRARPRRQRLNTYMLILNLKSASRITVPLPLLCRADDVSK